MEARITVNLATLLSLDTSFLYRAKFGVRILCTIEDKDIVVLWAKKGVFQLDCSNMKWKKSYRANYGCTWYPCSMILS
jgi:hypothetical protein